VNEHLVWDWNGTLLDDLTLVIAATNASLASVGGPAVSAEEHRRDFRRPIRDYYAHVLRRAIDEAEFAKLDSAFHERYRAGLVDCTLTPDALEAMSRWPGTQSLLSMFFHDELIVEIERHGLTAKLKRVDGLRGSIGGHRKEAYLVDHLAALQLDGDRCVLIGDSVDDAHAAQAVGARCVLYAGGFTDPELLTATGLPVAHSLLEAVEFAKSG
jgi:phosphoglycolate phosphatase-like HAD superfamily hydrolase